MRVLISIAVAVAVCLAVLLFARRPVAQFLVNRHLAAARSAIRDYLDGRTPLDSAAKRYNDELDESLPYLEASAPRLEPGAPGRLEAISMAPAGFWEDDPRIQAFYDRAQYLRLGPVQYQHLQNLRDSLNRVRSGRTH
jgi:hypothetical protein